MNGRTEDTVSKSRMLLVEKYDQTFPRAHTRISIQTIPPSSKFHHSQESMDNLGRDYLTEPLRS